MNWFNLVSTSAGPAALPTYTNLTNVDFNKIVELKLSTQVLFRLELLMFWNGKTTFIVL